jgi:hypothetical protein
LTAPPALTFRPPTDCRRSWLLGRGDIQLRPFRYLQEGFAIGDVVLIAAAVYCLRSRTGTPALWMTQAAMAGLWLAARVVFLARERGVRP